MMTLAADIGGTRIKLAVLENNEVLAQDSLDAHSQQGLAPQLPAIAKAFERLCGQIGINRNDCRAVCIAFPSLIDSETGRVLAAYGKYSDAPRLDLPRWAREELALPLVIDNDARLALLGEWRAGAGVGSDDLVMVTLGTGLGTAAVVQGNLLRGRHGQAGVLGGHLTVQMRGTLCTCGNRGCAEAEASTAVLPRLAAEHPQFATSTLQQCGVIDYAAVLQLARRGDACAQALRAKSIETWAALIVNLVHAYDPERVILGGGIMAGEADFLRELKDQVLSHAHTPWGRLQIIRAQLGDTAALIGASLLAKTAASKLQ